MLTIAMYVTGAVGYFVFGYLFGKLSNWVFRDDTPNDKAGLPKKTLRMLLYPVRFMNGWGDNRYIIDLDRLDLREFVEAGLRDTKNDEKYCQVMAFIWPLRPSLIMSIPICIIGLAMKIFQAVIVWPLGKIFKGINWLTSRTSDKRSVVHDQILKMRMFLIDNIEPRVREIDDSVARTRSLRELIQSRIDKARDLMSRHDLQDHIKTRCSSLLERFQQKYDSCTKNIDNALTLRNRIVNLSCEMRSLIEVLELQCDPVLDEDADMERTKETLDAALKAMRACQHLFGQISDAEVSVMRQNGDSPTQIADHRDQSNSRDGKLFSEEMEMMNGTVPARQTVSA